MKDIVEIRWHGRGGQGMKCVNAERTGDVAGIVAISDDDDIIAITDDGTMIRTPVNGISVYEGNNTSGVIVMRIADPSRIISFAATKSDEEEAAEIEASLEKSEVMAAQEIAFPIADEDEI